MTETGEFAADRATKLLERLAFQINRTRRRPDAKAVHDVRVAIRRFTQALVVFKPCFPARELKKIRRRLRDTMARAGEVRDCDIALKLLSNSQPGDAAGLAKEIRARRKTAEKPLLGSLRRWLARRTSSKCRNLLETGRAPDGFGRQSVEDTARDELARMVKGFFKRGAQAAKATSSAEEIHKFRITVKKLRYTLELFAPLYECGGRLEEVARVQRLLGSINDTRIVRGMAARIGGGGSFAAALKKRQRKKTREFRRLWADRFSQPGAAKQWMNGLRRPSQAPRPARKPMGRSAPAASAADEALEA